MNRIYIILSLMIAISISTPALADTKANSPEKTAKKPAKIKSADTSGANSIPAVLDFDRRWAKRTHQELFVFGGDYLGDSFGNSWITGAEYLYHLTKYVGVGTMFGYSKANYSENKYYATPGFFKNDNIYMMQGVVILSYPAAYRMGKHAVENDLYMIAGAGTMRINSSFEPCGFIGGGMKIYAWKPWFAIRVELIDQFHTTGKPAGKTKFDQDVVTLVGLSFQLPPKFKDKHEK